MKVVLPSGKQATRSKVWVVMWDEEPESVWSNELLAIKNLDALKERYHKHFKAIPAPLSSIHCVPLIVED